MNVLLIDNYDSFTYNLQHYLEGLGANVQTFFNDQIPFNQIDFFDKVVLSPGPGLPAEAGDLMLFIREFYQKVPILGVCLGFQAIIESLGGEIYNQNQVKHGLSEQCFLVSKSRLLHQLPSPFQVGLYHSWAAQKEHFPKELIVTSESENGIIMSFEHEVYPICGVQFHPESIMTENGLEIIKNFLTLF